MSGNTDQPEVFLVDLEIFHPHSFLSPNVQLKESSCWWCLLFAVWLELLACCFCYCRVVVGYLWVLFTCVFVDSLFLCGLFVGYVCLRPARNAPSSFHIDSSAGLFSFFTACLCLYDSITQLFIVFFWNKPDIFMDRFQLQMFNVLLFIITYKLFTRSQVIKKHVKTKMYLKFCNSQPDSTPV